MRRILLSLLLGYLLAACASATNRPESYETWRLPEPGAEWDGRVPAVWLGTGNDQAILGTVSSFGFEGKGRSDGGMTGMPASPTELGDLLARTELAAGETAVVIIGEGGESGTIRSVTASVQPWAGLRPGDFALFAGREVAGHSTQEGGIFAYTLEPLGTAEDLLLVVSVDFDNSQARGDIVVVWRLNPGGSAASDSPVIVSDPGSGLDTAQFIKALQVAGAAAEPVGPFTPAFFTGETQHIKVNGLDVQVYEYDDRATAEQEAEEAAPDGEIIIPAEWIATPHFYQSGRLIVQYIGDDPDVIALLESIVGPQFAKGG